MRKILPTIIIAIMLIISTTTVNAATADIDITLNGANSVEEGTKTLTLTLDLGKFTNVASGSVMGYEATLEYDKNLFKSVEVKGKNDWTVTYAESTKKILGETNSAKANTEITQITLTLKDNIEIGTKGNITLKDFNITDDINLDKTITLEKKDITLIEKVQNNNTNENTNTTTNTSKNTITGTNTNNSNSDQTITNTVLPKAGLKNILLISIILVILAGIGFYIRTKTIKVK